MTGEAARPTTWESLRAAAGSWRLLSVALLSFASGLPLGLVWLAVPVWMARSGIDIKVIGLFTLAQAPWSFKLLWSPAMDRYPLPLLGRKRGYMLVSLLALIGLSLVLAAVSDRPTEVWLIGGLCLAIAFASATFDIAYDAYAVEALEPAEQGFAVGARVAFYRAAMFASGGFAITLAAGWGWDRVNLAVALLYIPFVFVVARAPEPEVPAHAPLTLKDAVWGPFIGFLGKHRAFEILAFVVLYKLSDQLTQALTRPFLVQVGFDDFDVGVATTTIGQFSSASAKSSSAGCSRKALASGRALWIFGGLQLLSNLGYAVVAQVGVNQPVMYAAQGLEHICSGLGAGAFGVLLLRLTEKRFSATQYALLSSLFTLPRVLAGPVAGVAADAFGWRDFFILTVFTGIPGLLMLARFAPWNAREVRFEVATPRSGGPPRTRGHLVLCAFVGAVLTAVTSILSLACLKALARYRGTHVFAFADEGRKLLAPATLGDGLTVLGLVVVAVMGGLVTAASVSARRSPPTAE